MSTYEAKVIDGPEKHDFRSVELRWYDDGTLRVVVRSGKGPIHVNPMGTGNFRMAAFGLKRRPPK